MGNRRLACVCLLVFVLLSGLPPVAGALADLRDIRGPISSRESPPFGLTALVLLLSCFGLTLLRRRNLSPVQPGAAPASQPRSPDSLTCLHDDYRNGRVPVELLFIRLAGLINCHLSTAAGVAPSRLTTDEILFRTARILTDDTQHQLTTLLQLCDRVKFAAHRPTDRDVRQALEIAARILTTEAGGCGR